MKEKGIDDYMAQAVDSTIDDPEYLAGIEEGKRRLSFFLSSPWKHKGARYLDEPRRTPAWQIIITMPRQQEVSAAA